MFNISADNDVVTLIHVFTVNSEDQRDLVRLLDATTEEVLKHMPGFVAASTHRSIDGGHVASYAQWRSELDVEAMLENPLVRRRLVAAASLATAEPQPSLFEVVSTTYEPNPSSTSDP